MSVAGFREGMTSRERECVAALPLFLRTTITREVALERPAKKEPSVYRREDQRRGEEKPECRCRIVLNDDFADYHRGDEEERRICHYHMSSVDTADQPSLAEPVECRDCQPRGSQ